MRGNESRINQRRRRLIETIGRHPLEGRELGRSVGAEREPHRGSRNLSVAATHARTPLDGRPQAGR